MAQRESIAESGIGQPVRRKEDFRLLTGKGCYSDDFNLPGQVYAAMVRSPHAHARITAIECADALAMPGVLAVLTGADVAAAGVNSIPHSTGPVHPPDIALPNHDGSKHYVSPHLPMPTDKARFVGEVVAMVIAQSMNTAKDGAEQVRVDYEPLEAVTDSTAAVRPESPRLWEDASSNVCVDARVGNAAATQDAFARAAHVVRLQTWVQRVMGVPMEPRAALGVYDSASERYTLYTGNSGVVRQKLQLAKVFGVPNNAVRIVAKDVGGNFGTRNPLYPEYVLVLFAAKRLGRPVKWTGVRQEAFIGDSHGRDLVVEAELALDAQGKFLAVRGSNLSNLGAHTMSFVPLGKGVQTMSGIYDIPVAHFGARGVMSNTSPTNPLRSAGRPEAMFAIERLTDMAAREFGFDRVELRRRNLISEQAMPYANPLGMTYDSGAYEKAMDAALALGDWAGFPARRDEARKRGKLRGISVANYVEVTAGAPRERTEITVKPEGRVDVVIGTLSSGQGHETSFAQLVTEWLGVPFDSVRLVQGDTDIVSVGGGSHSGRSMRFAGIVIGNATRDIKAKGTRIAAQVLEAAVGDIEFSQGRFTVKGTDRSVGIFEVAAASVARVDLPEELRGPLAGESEVNVPVASFPYGCHVCEVEIDPETGSVAVVRYAAVDDVGRAVNPMILDGQTHGGIAQGLGQALMERCHYDSESGQMLSASFMDYALPRADTLPSFATEISEVPSTTNELGIRAGGEGGTTPALAAAINAIVDALAEYGIKHIEMPATAERVWRAIQAARAAH